MRELSFYLAHLIQMEDGKKNSRITIVGPHTAD